MPVEIILPKFGFTLETADIVQWLKQEGDKVRSGDPICEVTTDKVNMEVEAPENGTLWKFLYPQGATVPVTRVIAVMLRPNEQPPADSAALIQERYGDTPFAAAPSATDTAAPLPTVATATKTAMTPVARRVAQAANVALDNVTGTGFNNRITRRDVEAVLTAAEPTRTTASGKPRATPAARALAHDSGVDLHAVNGSGARGRVQRVDVERYLHTQPTAAAHPLPVETISAAPSNDHTDRTVIKMAGMRHTIAARLQKSFQDAPHIFFDAQIDTRAIEALRESAKARKEKLSVTTILVRAAAWTLLRHPFVNATLQGDEITQWHTANIGVAVALQDGLIVPVIHHVESLGLGAIQTRLDDVVTRSQNGGLRLHDMSDGTFTISNLGMYGVDRFTAIINPPQVAILAAGRTQRVFVPDESDQPVPKSFMQVTLSADHRVVDGAQAALFLNDLRDALQDPTRLLW